MTRVLLIDGGQNGCRGRYLRDGAFESALHGPALPRRGRDYGVLRALVDGEVDAVAAGLTGFAGDAAAVARALGAPRAVVTNDAVTAYLGALGAMPGVVVVAGTGVIALAASEDGRWARAGGWGTLLGDDGGGYWIGRRGLALALRARDGRDGGSAALLARAEARSGADFVRAVYDAPDPVAVVASFAPDVAEAAHAGDPVAAEIWSEAGRELAQTAAAALTGDRPRSPSFPGPPPSSPPGVEHKGTVPSCSWSGGLFGAGELLLAPFTAELGRLVPGVEVRAPLGSPLDGAARLLERPPLFESLIVEAGAP